LRRASAASDAWIAARRRSSMPISRFASPESPRRFSAASKASGLSRIHLMSCIGVWLGGVAQRESMGIYSSD
jgi:hypothetical protein